MDKICRINYPETPNIWLAKRALNMVEYTGYGIKCLSAPISEAIIKAQRISFNVARPPVAAAIPAAKPT
jgi:hypothetical protein